MRRLCGPARLPHPPAAPCCEACAWGDRCPCWAGCLVVQPKSGGRRAPALLATDRAPRLAARAGSAAAKGASVAAKVTLAVGVQAIKAAVPVGKWALQQGFKAAAGAVARGLQPEEKKRGKKEKGA